MYSMNRVGFYYHCTFHHPSLVITNADDWAHCKNSYIQRLMYHFLFTFPYQLLNSNNSSYLSDRSKYISP